ncbi:AAA ATPase domain-containing protein [Micromonospora echinofusca]|uniref:AAA ATPase domain-containing protein n=1 Tax=Micromonospora echinofusca TaxID=47858 RepID=A0A1C5GH88_MICEH|nr:LuxR C-terminal-related transcriptional regulator [Micromonospora echinofusca]SCG19191.1 AAA ATPase domain-containing protein [Micromonospora echinofusca]
MPDAMISSTAQIGRRWPLVGRDPDIDRTIDRLLAPEGRAVLVTGPTGVGKSRVLEAVLHRCVAKGHHVLPANGTMTDQGAPLGVARHLAPQVEPLDTAPAGALHRLIESLPRPTGQHLVVLAVDNVSGLDEAAARLVGKLASEQRVRVLLAAAETAIGTGPVDVLRRTVRLDRVDLAPLDWQHTRQLISAAFGTDVDGLTADGLWRLTGGNPLLLRELLRNAVENDALTLHDHVVGWRQGTVVRAWAGDALTGPLEPLSTEESAALRYIAYGDGAPVDVIEHLAPMSVIERLEELGLIRLDQSDPSTLVTVAHPITARTVRTRTGPLRARRVHAELVAALEATGSPDRVRDVLWRLAARFEVPDDEVLRASAEALLGHDAATAEQLARQVHGPAAAWHLGRALLARGSHRSAERWLAEAYRNLTDPAARANAAALRAVNRCWGIDEPDSALRMIAEARAALPADVHADLLAAEAFVMAFGGPAAEAADAVDQLSQHPPRDPLLAGVVPPLRPRLLLLGGRPERAVAEFPTDLSGKPSIWPAMRALLQATHVQALIMAGAVRQAADLVGRHYRDAVEHGTPDGVATIALAGGICAYYQGNAGQAARWLREARALTAERVGFRFRETLLAIGVGVEAQLGQVEKAQELLSRLRRGATARTASDYGAFGEVWALVISGNRTGAATLLRRLAAEAARAGDLLMATEFLHVEVRLAPSAAAASRVRELAAKTDGRLFALLAEHAEALARRDARVLNRVSATFEELGYRGFALEAAANGAMFGGGRVTNALARRTQRLLGEHQGTWPEWLPEPRTAPALTDRERQVSELAATGMDTPAIARALTISARTAENHLHRAYSKLGIHRRHELARALAEDGFVLPTIARQVV